ncbi:MAG TPA: CBS domain-containing protein [Ktedonobacteraceae bacterium]|nr:CBS domain-containing protein [Ktedonobacteraceae bacterium]
MMYLSQMPGATVENMQGARVGKIVDVLVDAINRVPTIVVEGEAEQRWYVPANTLQRTPTAWQLSTEAITDGALSGQPVSLMHEVLDKQVIDVEHKKAVRVNDVCFADDWRILGIDNSALGLVRRLAPSWLLSGRSKRPPATLIPWEHIELIDEPRVQGDHEEEEDQGRGSEVTSTGTDQRDAYAHEGPHPSTTPPPSLRRTSGQLAELRAADIADIVYQLTPGQGARLLEGLDDETAADALEELDTERQSHILENISAERAADILQAMEPDEATDLVARLPEERAQELLRLMTPEESEDVQELLEYEEDTAGGIMTTDFVAIDATKTAGDALEAVRYNIREQDVRLAYVYCIADEASEDYTLLGIVSLWDLLVADAAQPLRDLMETDLVTVQPDAEPRAVAGVMAKYNFLAVPVVSEAGTLEGVVTIDDALDVLLPGERRKPHRMY